MEAMMTFKTRTFRSATLPGMAAALMVSLGMFAATASEANAVSAACKKLDPNGQDTGGDTNFALAIRDKKGDVVKKMLACGAKLDMKTTEGWYPLHTAAYYGPASMIDLLVSKGADVNVAYGGTTRRCGHRQDAVEEWGRQDHQVVFRQDRR
jgi:ankyrin repeat protein